MFTSMFKVVCGLIGLYEVQSVYVYDSMPMNFGYLGKLNKTNNYDYHSTDGLGNTCCLSCSVGKMKYYKLMNNKRQCEEVCLTKNEYTFYRYSKQIYIFIFIINFFKTFSLFFLFVLSHSLFFPSHYSEALKS